MSTFAQNLKRLRKQKGFSQTQLASLLHYGSTAIANYEAGRNEPSFNSCYPIIRSFAPESKN